MTALNWLRVTWRIWRGTKLGAQWLFVFYAASLTGTATIRAGETRLRILLASDIYKMSGENGRGGHARLAAVVKAERAKGGAFYYVHAGDALSPCLLCSFDKGEHHISLMNLVPPDLFVPGNHEYDFGKDVFLKRMREGRFPILAANLKSADESVASILTASRIFHVGDVKVGFVGLTADDSPQKSNPDDLSFASSVETLSQEADRLRDDGAQFIVAVAHSNRAMDRKLMATQKVDLLLSGDDHDLAWSYDGKTAFVEGGEDAQYLSLIEVEFKDRSSDSGGLAWTPALRLIDTKDVVPDEAVSAEVAKYEATLSNELDAKVGDVSTSFDTKTSTVRSKENFMGNLIADALRHGYAADLALMNGGGIRGGKDYSAGMPFTRRDILTELPFTNKAVVLEMSGADFSAILEYGLSKLPDPFGGFPNISGCTVNVNFSAAIGSRVTSIAMPEGPIVQDKIYKVVTNDFLLRGGDGYPLPGKSKILVRPEDGRLIANEVLAYLARHPMGSVAVGGRIAEK